MIRSPNDKQPFIAFETIKLIEEEGPVLVVDKTVQIFKDYDAGGELPRFAEHVSHSSLFSFVTWSG
jgi:hypothetical protein